MNNGQSDSALYKKNLCAIFGEAEYLVFQQWAGGGGGGELNQLMMYLQRLFCTRESDIEVRLS